MAADDHQHGVNETDAPGERQALFFRGKQGIHQHSLLSNSMRKNEAEKDAFVVSCLSFFLIKLSKKKSRLDLYESNEMCSEGDRRGRRVGGACICRSG
jgi:hypothetical protein